MSGSIVRALGWDDGYEQRFLAVNPLGDEVTLYGTQDAGDNNDSHAHELRKVASYSGTEHIQCMAYSRTRFGWAGVGTMDGTAHIFDVTQGGGGNNGNNNASSNVSSIQLRSKHHRPCNSLSFNEQQLVAASFDKSRQDNSLQVWDLTKHTPVFAAGDGARAVRAHAGYLANEATLSTLFNPSDPSGMLLMAGGYKLLREFDLRDSAPAPIYSVATKSTMHLAQDPFQPHLFSSVGEDGSVSVWDRRKLLAAGAGKTGATGAPESPALFFPKLMSDSSRRGTPPCFRYSTVRRGEFAAVFNGDVIRRWNTGLVPGSSMQPTFTSKSDVVTGLKQQSAQLYNPIEDQLFVALVLDCKTDLPRVVSFDYSPDTSSHTSTNFVCMREKGSVFRMPVAESIEAVSFNSWNEFSVAGPEGTFSKFLDSVTDMHTTQSVPGNHLQAKSDYEAHRNFSEEAISTIGDEESTEPLSGTRPQSDHAYAETSNPPAKRSSGEEAYLPLRRILDLSDVVKNDICSAIRQRVECGYAVDSERNYSVLENIEGAGASLSLRNTWKWITLAKKSLEKGTMVKEGVDLGYVGVLAMWKGVEELSGQNRVKNNKPVSDEMFSSTVRAIVASKGEKSSSISVLHSSSRPLQRKLSLIVSGWYLAASEFDQKLTDLVKDGQVEKAAGWAVFHGDVSRAIAILSASKKERLQLMSTAVAGYMAYKDSNINSPWNDQCRKLSSELDNPYLRAIFAFIADNDWWDVLDEHSLPLRERLGIAIRFLSDKDLNVYLNRVADSVVLRGELEGLILTGLTPRGIDLLQSYVDRTSDVQTAALIAQFAVPRYFRDQRVDHWIDCYREMLNSWGYFKYRAKFDVARTKFSRSSNNVVTIQPAPRQVYLQCKQCKKNMSSIPSKNSKGATNTSILMKQFNHRLSLKSSTSYFNSCPHCGSQLPRCAICLLTLGGPISQGVDQTSTDGNASSVQDDFDNKFSFCLSCSHGYHAHHAEEWFSKHYICPVPDCNCRCNSK